MNGSGNREGGCFIGYGYKTATIFDITVIDGGGGGGGLGRGGRRDTRAPIITLLLLL